VRQQVVQSQTVDPDGFLRSNQVHLLDPLADPVLQGEILGDEQLRKYRHELLGLHHNHPVQVSEHLGVEVAVGRHLFDHVRLDQEQTRARHQLPLAIKREFGHLLARLVLPEQSVRDHHHVQLLLVSRYVLVALIAVVIRIAQVSLRVFFAGIQQRLFFVLDLLSEFERRELDQLRHLVLRGEHAKQGSLFSHLQELDIDEVFLNNRVRDGIHCGR